MKNLTLGLLVAVTTTVLSGCALYFADDSDETWTYCGSDGYYQCEDENCQWVSSTCPDQGWGSGSGGQGGGFSCTSSADCAAGCYCANGICEEAGFCTQDSDCGNGYVCNEERSSCEPGGGTSCDYDYECAQGEYCSWEHECVATCTCTDDEGAVSQGWGWCDESRNTCLPGQDPAGTCAGDPVTTCTAGMPSCPLGQVPTLIDGCWTGQCRDYAQCDVNPSCSHINNEAQCLGQSGCSTTVNGINCKKPDGTACQAGDTGCTCDSYVFASCRATP
jgi:hypothetical protein